MELNPDIAIAAESGELSFEKASLIARLAKNNVTFTEGLMAHVDEPYEALRRRGFDLHVKTETTEEHEERLRASQYAVVEETENFYFLQAKLLKRDGVKWLPKWKQFEREALHKNSALLNPLPRSAASAEAFSAMLAESGGSSKGVVNYHVRLEDWAPETCEVAGLGVVPISVLQSLGEHPALRLLITARNKLLWYSEAGYRPDGPLPEFIKRAVKAHSFHHCDAPGCVESADQVDHKLARTNGGVNALDNLQSLCEADHAGEDEERRTVDPRRNLRTAETNRAAARRHRLNGTTKSERTGGVSPRPVCAANAP